MARKQSRKSSESSERTGKAEKQNVPARREFSNEDKIRALTAMFTTNPQHPYGIDALEAARAILGQDVSTQTLHSWIMKYKDEVRSLIPQRSNKEIVLETYDQITAQWEQVRNKYLAHLNDDFTALTASARDAVIVAGTAQDKLDRSRGLSPEIMVEITAILKLCEMGALDPVLALRDHRQQIQDYLASKTIYIETGSEAHSTELIETGNTDDRPSENTAN